MPATCPLCQPANAIWSGRSLYVILVPDSPFPGYTRVVWHDHIAEMSDLSTKQAQHLLQAIMLVEQCQRDLLGPDKINLAQFGNQVPHLHWHLIPRWRTDPYFPESAWSPAPVRTQEQHHAWAIHHETLRLQLADYEHALLGRLQDLTEV